MLEDGAGLVPFHTKYLCYERLINVLADSNIARLGSKPKCRTRFFAVSFWLQGSSE